MEGQSCSTFGSPSPPALPQEQAGAQPCPGGREKAVGPSGSVEPASQPGKPRGEHGLHPTSTRLDSSLHCAGTSSQDGHQSTSWVACTPPSVHIHSSISPFSGRLQISLLTLASTGSGRGMTTEVPQFQPLPPQAQHRPLGHTSAGQGPTLPCVTSTEGVMWETTDTPSKVS